MSELDLLTTVSIKLRASAIIRAKKQAGMIRDDNVPIVYKSFSDAIRKKIELADYVESFKSEANKPEFVEKIRQLQEGAEVTHWIQTMTDDQKRAIMFLIKNHFDEQRKVASYL